MWKQNSVIPLCWAGSERVRRLRRELDAADVERSSRYTTIDSGAIGYGDYLDELVAGAGREIDCSLFLNRVIARTQMKADCIGAVDTRIERLIVDRLLARCLATMACEIMHFCDRGSGRDGSVDLLCALGTHSGHVILTIAVEGVVGPVPTATGMNALKRARRIVDALSGLLKLKFDGERTLIGLAVPTCNQQGPRSTRRPARGRRNGS